MISKRSFLEKLLLITPLIDEHIFLGLTSILIALSEWTLGGVITSHIETNVGLDPVLIQLLLIISGIIMLRYKNNLEAIDTFILSIPLIMYYIFSIAYSIDTGTHAASHIVPTSIFLIASILHKTAKLLAIELSHEYVDSNHEEEGGL